MAHVEQGLGEVLRRLEKKVDGVASLVDRGALELLEARLAGGVAALEARLGALEAGAEAQRQPPAAGAWGWVGVFWKGEGERQVCIANAHFLRGRPLLSSLHT